MLTKHQAITENKFEHVTLKNMDKTPLRARRNGKTKTWKTKPDDFSLPVKYGMEHAFKITQADAHNWKVAGE